MNLIRKIRRFFGEIDFESMTPNDALREMRDYAERDIKYQNSNMAYFEEYMKIAIRGNLDAGIEGILRILKSNNPVAFDIIARNMKEQEKVRMSQAKLS